MNGRRKVFTVLMIVLALGVLVSCRRDEIQTVRERTCLYARCDSWIVNGSDILFYSDDLSTLKAAIYGDSGNLYSAGSMVYEGATADAYETTVSVVDPTADRTVTIPNETGAVMMSSLATNGTAITNSVTGGTNVLVWEGATADGYETSVSATDPTADRSVVLADGGGTVMLSSLATNATDAANSVTGASNGLVFEGATAGDYETTLSVTDPTADRSVVFADGAGTVMLSSLATNAPDAANSVSGASASLVFEGSSADEHETSLTVTNPTADRTATLPNVSGTIHINEATQNLTANTGIFNGDVDMQNNEITNIGVAGTDFGDDGSLTTAQTITVTAGGANITGGLTISEGDLADSVILSADIKDGEIVNADVSASADIAYSKMEDFLKLTEGAVQVMTYGCTLTSVASFQPITSTAVITNVVIADGSVAGQIVVISNENAADDITILESGSNLEAGGDVTLTGGAYDLLTLLWDGARWIRLAFFDN